MTDQTDAELIAQALRTTGNASLYRALSDRQRALNRLSDELEAMRIERDNWRLSAEEAERGEKRWKDRAVEAGRAHDQLAAVAEKVRAEVEGESGWFRHRAGRVLDILAASPADALRELKADVWDEGFDAYEEDHLHHEAHGWGDEDCIDKTWNPYRAREEQDRG